MNDNMLNNTLNTRGSTNEPIIMDITKFKINSSENIQDTIKFVAVNKIAGKCNIKTFNIAPNSSRLEIRLDHIVLRAKELNTNFVFLRPLGLRLDYSVRVTGKSRTRGQVGS